MRSTLAIARREVGSYFNSPIAYIFIPVFLILVSAFFFPPLFLNNQAEVRDLFGPATTFLLAVFAPALTMRAIAEERASGTLELLITMPVSDWQVVIGKFLGAFTLFAVTVGLMAIYGITIAWLGPLDKGAAFTAYFGFLLLGAMFIAISLAASAWTRSQIVAFIIGVLICFGLWLLGKYAYFFPTSMQPLVEFLGIDMHMTNAARGVIDTRDLLYFGSFIGGSLLLAQQTLESRKWR
jgi:gliding motility-associated transport system permease protein